MTSSDDVKGTSRHAIIPSRRATIMSLTFKLRKSELRIVNATLRYCFSMFEVCFLVLVFSWGLNNLRVLQINSAFTSAIHGISWTLSRSWPSSWPLCYAFLTQLTKQPGSSCPWISSCLSCARSKSFPSTDNLVLNSSWSEKWWDCLTLVMCDRNCRILSGWDSELFL